MYKFRKHETSIQLVCYAQTRNKKQETRNKKQETLIKFVAIIALTALGFKGMSQCNAHVYNNLTCPVKVTIIILDNIPPNGCVPANICQQFTSITIPANSSVPVNCTGCSNPCNMMVKLEEVDGAALTTPSSGFLSVDANFSTSANWQQTNSNNCSSGTLSYNLGSIWDFIIQ